MISINNEAIIWAARSGFQDPRAGRFREDIQLRDGASSSLKAPRPSGEREGPGPQGWEGEGAGPIRLDS